MCTGFITHYFHFLEQILPVWEKLADDADKIDTIIFSSQPDLKNNFQWEGTNQINKIILEALFPNAKVYINIQANKLNHVLYEKIFVSSRYEAHKYKEVGVINKMMGKCINEITPSKLDSFRTKILIHMGITPSEYGTNITYLHRHPPRCLSHFAEHSLLNNLSAIAGCQIGVTTLAMIPFKNQLEIINSTKVLISVHGNGLSHIPFLPHDAKVIEIFPNSSFTWDYCLLAKIKKLKYLGTDGAYIVTDQTQIEPGYLKDNVNCPVTLIEIKLNC